MRLFDSHCHIDDTSFNKDIDDVILRAKKAGVQAALIAGVTLKTSQKGIQLAESYDGIYAAVGIHPHDAADCSDKILDKLKSLAKNKKVRAWGETGLDFNRMFSPQELQEKWFEKQIDIAQEIDLPLIFHERDSEGRFLDILKSRRNTPINGVVHCFSGNLKELEAYLDLGLYIGVTGIITIKKRGAELRRLVQYIPEDRLLIETDAPYLTPAPEKNKTRRNEPAFVKSTFLKIAEIKEKNPEKFAVKIWNNTVRLFNIEFSEPDHP